MEINNIELLAFILFAVAIAFSNFAAWRMGKNLSSSFGTAPKWKLIFDVTLPKNILTDRGLFWRKISIASFIFLVAAGVFCGFVFTGKL